MEYRQYRQSNRAGSMAWLFQRVSGIGILVLLIVHLWVTHYFPGGFVTFDKVATRLDMPGWRVLDLFFLAILLFHAFYGLWMITLDYVHRDWQRLALYSIFWVAALVIFLYGAVTLLPFARA